MKLVQFGVDGGPQREVSGEMGTTVQVAFNIFEVF